MIPPTTHKNSDSYICTEENTFLQQNTTSTEDNMSTDEEYINDLDFKNNTDYKITDGLLVNSGVIPKLPDKKQPNIKSSDSKDDNNKNNDSINTVNCHKLLPSQFCHIISSQTHSIESSDDLKMNYTTQTLIYKSGFASIFKATEKKSSQIIVLKHVEMRTLSRKLWEKNCQTEIKFLKVCAGSGICKLLHWFYENDTCILVQPFAKYGDLHDLLHVRDLWTWPTIRNVIKQILQAVMHIHSIGVVHRDIKPANVFIISQPGPTMQLVLGDFGFARYSNNYVLMTKDFAGTGDFMAPEVLSALKSKGHIKYNLKKADMWAVGVTAFMVITGAKPYTDLVAPYKAGLSYTFQKLKQDRRHDRILTPLLRRDPKKRCSAKSMLKNTLFTKLKKQ